MSYQIEKGTGDIVINGFEKGIADDPYDGISNLRNINTTSIPKEASVNFATSAISPPIISTGTVTSANAGTDYLTFTGATGLENMMTIVFSVTTVGGITINTPYWISNLNGAGAGTFKLTSDYAQASGVDISGTGTGTFSVAKVGTEPITGIAGTPKFFTYSPIDNCYFMLTTEGSLWTNEVTTTSGYWTYTGPSGTAQVNQGCGMAFYQAFDGVSSGHRYVFVFRNQTIDYWNVALKAWSFGWKPSNGTAGNAGTTLNTSTSYHNAFVAQSNTMYWCDGSFLGSIKEVPGSSFDPTSTATYTYPPNGQALALPNLDQSQCLTQLGDKILTGGKNNIIYPWDELSPSFGTEIQLAESNVQQLVTINTNTFIFVGNRGRIYYTNGLNASLFKKIPDHISDTVEPYFNWGGATFVKNQMYFSFSVTTNAGVTINTYGGVWGLDVETKALRLANTLSYQTTTYNGSAGALIANFSTTATGTGLFIGWNNGSTVSGIDTTTSTPYSGSTAVAVGIVDSDLIPIGTFLQPMTNGRIEFKLSTNLVAGESIQLYYRQKFSDSFTAVNGGESNNGFFNTVGMFSGACIGVNFAQSQWIQIRAVTISTASSPSYTRLTELRLGKFNG